MGMHVAGRTQNIRIGTAVTLASFYHPLRIAEEVALLDVLSGGRVNWGAGRGFDQTEFRAFDVPVEESYPRFRESVQIVLEAWRNERITWHGDYYDFDEIEVLPKPQQQPTPPFWVAAGSDDALDWAGEQGYSILMDPARRPRRDRREAGALHPRAGAQRALACGPHAADGAADRRR